MSTPTETETPDDLSGIHPSLLPTAERMIALARENAQLRASLALYEQTDKLCEGGKSMAEMRLLQSENAQLRAANRELAAAAWRRAVALASGAPVSQPVEESPKQELELPEKPEIIDPGKGWRLLEEGEPLQPGDGYLLPDSRGTWIDYECRPDIFRGCGKEGQGWYYVPTNDTAHTWRWRRKIKQPNQHGVSALTGESVTFDNAPQPNQQPRKSP